MKRSMSCAAALGVACLLASCTDPHQDEANRKLEGEIASLNTRVTALESAQTHSTAEAPGSWILWQRFEVLKTKPGVFLTGPAPAKPMGAYSSKRECEDAAREAAQEHGGNLGQSEYLVSDSYGTSRVFYSCLPKGVDVRN